MSVYSPDHGDKRLVAQGTMAKKRRRLLVLRAPPCALYLALPHGEASCPMYYVGGKARFARGPAVKQQPAYKIELCPAIW